MLRAGSLLLGAVLVAGCTPDLGKGCTLIGGFSGVTVAYTEVLQDHRREPLVVEACVDDECERLDLGPTRRQDAVILSPDLEDGDPREVRLTISAPNGDVVHESRLTVRPSKGQPNGPGCEPTTWTAQVNASGRDTLERVD